MPRITFICLLISFTAKYPYIPYIKNLISLLYHISATHIFQPTITSRSRSKRGVEDEVTVFAASERVLEIIRDECEAEWGAWMMMDNEFAPGRARRHEHPRLYGTKGKLW